MPAGPSVSFNVDGFKNMTYRMKDAVKRGGELAVLTVAQDIYDRTSSKLQGPHYGFRKGPRGGYVPDYPEGGGQKGKIPIPRLTGNLARSLKIAPLTRFIMAIWCDEKIAEYAKWIHNGAKGRRPRRFLKDTFDQREAAGKRTMRSIIGAAIRDAQ